MEESKQSEVIIAEESKQSDVKMGTQKTMFMKRVYFDFDGGEAGEEVPIESVDDLVEFLSPVNAKDVLGITDAICEVSTWVSSTPERFMHVFRNILGFRRFIIAIEIASRREDLQMECMECEDGIVPGARDKLYQMREKAVSQIFQHACASETMLMHIVKTFGITNTVQAFPDEYQGQFINSILASQRTREYIFKGGITALTEFIYTCTNVQSKKRILLYLFNDTNKFKEIIEKDNDLLSFIQICREAKHNEEEIFDRLLTKDILPHIIDIAGSETFKSWCPNDDYKNKIDKYQAKEDAYVPSSSSQFGLGLEQKGSEMNSIFAPQSPRMDHHASVRIEDYSEQGNRKDMTSQTRNTMANDA